MDYKKQIKHETGFTDAQHLPIRNYATLIKPIPRKKRQNFLLRESKENGSKQPADPVNDDGVQYDGFVFKSKKKLTLRAPTGNKSYAFKFSRNKITIWRADPKDLSRGLITDAQDILPNCEVIIYNAYTKNKAVDKSRCYMQLRDLEIRVADESAKVTKQLKEDVDIMKINNGSPSILPFKIWTGEGKSASLQELIHFKFGVTKQARSRPITDLWFEIMYQIAMKAQKQSAQYNVLSRFWDAPVDIPKDFKFTIVVPELYGRSSEEDLLADIQDQLEILYQSPGIKFCPPIENAFQITVEKDLSIFKLPEGQFRLGKHPNELYCLDASRDKFRELVKSAGGKLHAPPLEFKYSDEEAQKKAFLDEVAKIKTLVKKQKEVSPGGTIPILHNETTGTKSTIGKDKVDGTTGIKRELSQNQVMGGNSANLLMKALFKSQGAELKGEWLHRSARSFGGLNEGDEELPLSSTQTVQNLVLGTPQTNTMMLRYEMFIKRFVNNAKSKSKSGDPVQLKLVTRLLHGTTKANEFNRRKSSLWFGHFLVYFYEAVGETVPFCKRRHTFLPFSRRTPMRLEAELDLIMEKIVYGWGKDALSAEDALFDNQAENPATLKTDDTDNTVLVRNADGGMEIERELSDANLKELQEAQALLPTNDVLLQDVPNTDDFLEAEDPFDGVIIEIDQNDAAFLEEQAIWEEHKE